METPKTNAELMHEAEVRYALGLTAERREAFLTAVAKHRGKEHRLIREVREKAMLQGLEPFVARLMAMNTRQERADYLNRLMLREGPLTKQLVKAEVERRWGLR